MRLLINGILSGSRVEWIIIGCFSPTRRFGVGSLMTMSAAYIVMLGARNGEISV